MFILLNFILSLIIPTKVYINLEKINPVITHTGITFKNDKDIIRFDFRAFNDDDNYLTTPETRLNISEMFPNLNYKFLEYKGFNEFRSDVLLNNNEVFLGETNLTLHEIIEYEKTINKKYILGIYDCRHYVNEFSLWSLNKSSPIWNLHKLL